MTYWVLKDGDHYIIPDKYAGFGWAIDKEERIRFSNRDIAEDFLKMMRKHFPVSSGAVCIVRVRTK